MERAEAIEELKKQVEQMWNMPLNSGTVNKLSKWHTGEVKNGGRVSTGGVHPFEVIEKLHLLIIYLWKEIPESKLNDKEACKELDKWAEDLIEYGTWYVQVGNNEHDKLRTVPKIKEAYQIMGRRHFEKFLVAIEWNYSPDMKFYDIRKNVLRDWAIECEKLEYGEYKGLSISAPPRTGKALSDDCKVLTVDGWKRMGDIVEGDYIIGSEGQPVEVLGVFPQGKKEMYRVIFDDKTEVKCSKDHLWEVSTREDRRISKYSKKEKRSIAHNKNTRIVTTEEMLKNLYVENGKRKNYTIDYIKPVQYKSKLNEDDLHPYIIGALIGDGYIGQKRNTRIKITSSDKEIIDRFIELLPKTDCIKYDRKYDYGIIKKEDTRNSMGYRMKSTTQKKLEEYGLYGKHSIDKFIPKKYLYGTIEERIELLRGLMDTDGYTQEKSGTAEFATISKQLANDVTELARSLGCRVVRSEKIGKYKNKQGEIVICNKVYRLYIKSEINPFWLKRKANKYVTRENHIRKVKYIAAIEKIPNEECTCIYVNSPDHLFIAEGYNLTHNTAIGTIFFMWCGLRHPEKSCFFVSHTRSNGRKSL